ncbi:MAG: GAF domain-containing protein [Anaerolineae bacterium]
MTRFLRSLNFVHWPLWVKISLGFLTAILVPVIILLISAASIFNSVGRDRLRDNLRHEAEHQVGVLNANLQGAFENIDQIVNGGQFGDTLPLLFQPVDRDETLVKTVAEELRIEMGETDFFRALRIVSVDGVLISQITSGGVINGGGTENTSPTYINAQSALIQRRDSSVTLTEAGTIKLEITQTIRNDSGDVVGFLIGTYSEQDLLIAPLAVDDESYTGYTYLVAGGRSQFIVTTPGIAAEVSASLANPEAAEFALKGETGIASYGIGENKDINVLGYYAPIVNPLDDKQVLFALVAEAQLDKVTNSAQQYLDGSRIFILVIGFLTTLILLVLLFNQTVTPPLVNLLKAMQAVTRGDFDQPVIALGRDDEIGQLGAAFVDMRTHVRGLLEDLEARIAARARDISATQEVSRFAATQRNLQTLLEQVVELIVDKFPSIYHAQIFLLDSTRSDVVLRASTGEIGKKMLAHGHHLNVGSQSLVGQSVLQRQQVVVRDTTVSLMHRVNEFLPETRAEAVIPLRIADQVIGVLDVQSKQRNSFNPEEVTILQTMADQVAVAIENARLYQESVLRLEQIEQANRNATLKTWQDFVYSQRQRGLASQAGVATGNDLSELRRKAIEEKRIVVGQVTPNQTLPIAVPISLRGQTLGAVEWEIPEADFNGNKLQMAQELANRLAVSLDNARLFQESQRATERERIVNAISAKLTPQTQIDDILQTAVREVGQALRAPQVKVQLHRPAATNGNGAHPKNEN